MAGASVDFKVSNLIDKSIISDLKNITEETNTTAAAYAALTQVLAKGIHMSPGNIGELEQKTKLYNTTLKDMYAAQNRLAVLQEKQIKILTEVAKKIDQLSAPLNTLAKNITSFQTNVNAATESLSNISNTSQNASQNISDAAKSASAASVSYESIIRTVEAFDEQAKKLNDSLSKNQVKLKDVRSILSQLDKAYAQGEVEENRYYERRASLLKQERELSEENKRYSALLRNHVQVSISASGSYHEMNAAVLELTKRYKELGKAQREGAEGKELLANIGQLNKELKSIDASMGNYQRSVGNYASHWNGLNMSIQQLARELPSLSVGANTFFLAISNNLPNFVDELKKAQTEYNNLKKAGQSATPVFKQVLGSLVSWQTALVVGITILSTYGGEIAKWVGSLFDAKKEIDILKQLQEDLNKAQLEGAKNAQSEAVKLDVLYKSAVNLNKPMADRNRAVEELKKQYPSYFKNMNDENILAGKAADSYQRLASAIVSAAKARATQDKIVENAKRQLELEEQIDEKYVEQEKALLRLELAEKGLNDARLLSQTELNQLSILGAEAASYSLNVSGNAIMSQYNSAKNKVDKIEADLSKLRKEASAIELENNRLANSINIGDITFDPHASDKAVDDYANYIKDINEQLSSLSVSLIEDEHRRNLSAIEKDYNDRLSAIKGYSADEMRLREMLAQEREQKFSEENDRYSKALAAQEIKTLELRLEGVREGSEEELELRLELLKKREEAEIDAASGSGAQILFIEKKYAQLRNDVQKDMLDKRLSMIDHYADVEATRMSTAQINSETELYQQYQDGLISREEYEREKLKLEQHYAEMSLRLAIETAKAQIALMPEGPEKEKATENLLNDMAKLKGIMSGVGYEFDKFGNKSDEWKEKWIGAIEDVSNAFGAVTDMVSGIYDAKISSVEKEQEENEAAGEAEIARIEALEERGAITTEEAEARKRAAEDKTARRNEELEKKKAALQTKQAKLEKAANIAQITMNTAAAIMKVWGQTGIFGAPMAAIVAAIGAIQLATAIATPIPQYAKGTDSHKGGLAIVGDGGVSETVITDKGAYITPSVPTLVDLPKGAQVIPYMIDMERMKANANDLDGLMSFRKENDLPPISIVNDYSDLEREIVSLKRSQQAGFRALANAIKDNSYQQFAKSI